MALSAEQVRLFRERVWLNLGPVFDVAELDVKALLAS